MQKTIYGSEAVALFMVIKEHVIQHNDNTAHLCVLNSFWTTMEFCDPEEYNFNRPVLILRTMYCIIAPDLFEL